MGTAEGRTEPDVDLQRLGNLAPFIAAEAVALVLPSSSRAFYGSPTLSRAPKGSLGVSESL